MGGGLREHNGVWRACVRVNQINKISRSSRQCDGSKRLGQALTIVLVVIWNVRWVEDMCLCGHWGWEEAEVEVSRWEGGQQHEAEALRNVSMLFKLRVQRWLCFVCLVLLFVVNVSAMFSVLF